MLKSILATKLGDFESTENWIFNGFPLPLDHSKLIICFLSSLICYSPVYSFHLSGILKDCKLLLIKCIVSQNMKEHDINRQQVIKTAHQTHRIPPLQSCKDPSKIIPCPLVRAARAA